MTANWKPTVAGVAFAAGLVLASGARAEDWSDFNACMRRNLVAVERAEPSLFDGSRLIVDVLCVEQSAALANQMTREPSRKDTVAQKGFSGAFSDFLYVIRRETTAALFEARKRRLGL